MFDKIKSYLEENDHFAKILGMRVDEISEGHGKVSMPLERKHLNGVGIAHGGAVFALADFALAVAANSRGKVALGVGANITYYAPGITGPLAAEAREISGGTRLAHYDIKITDGNGIIIARCTATAYKKKDAFPPDEFPSLLAAPGGA